MSRKKRTEVEEKLPTVGKNPITICRLAAAGRFSAIFVMPPGRAFKLPKVNLIELA